MGDKGLLGPGVRGGASEAGSRLGGWAGGQRRSRGPAGARVCAGAGPGLRPVRQASRLLPAEPAYGHSPAPRPAGQGRAQTRMLLFTRLCREDF